MHSWATVGAAAKSPPPTASYQPGDRLTGRATGIASCPISHVFCGPILFPLNTSSWDFFGVLLETPSVGVA